MSFDRELGLAFRMLPVAGAVVGLVVPRVDLVPEGVTLLALSALLALAVVYEEVPTS